MYCSGTEAALTATRLLATIPGAMAEPRLTGAKEFVPGPELLPVNAELLIFAAAAATTPLTTPELEPLLAIAIVPACVAEYPNAVPACRERLGGCCCEAEF
jgi:hypothetical protein